MKKFLLIGSALLSIAAYTNAINHQSGNQNTDNGNNISAADVAALSAKEKIISKIKDFAKTNPLNHPTFQLDDRTISDYMNNEVLPLLNKEFKTSENIASYPAFHSTLDSIIQCINDYQNIVTPSQNDRDFNNLNNIVKELRKYIKDPIKSTKNQNFRLFRFIVSYKLEKMKKWIEIYRSES